MPIKKLKKILIMWLILGHFPLPPPKKNLALYLLPGCENLLKKKKTKTLRRRGWGGELFCLQVWVSISS
jgi:hypothetical protein